MKMLIVKRNVCGFCGRHVGGGRMGKLPFGPAICPACAGLPIDALLGANGGNKKAPAADTARAPRNARETTPRLFRIHRTAPAAKIAR